MLEVQPPWRRLHEDWVCAECGNPATGTIGEAGIIVFYCDEHYDALSDFLIEDDGGLGFGAARGYSGIRWTWTQWLVRLWESRWRLNPVAVARTRRRGQQESEQLAVIFGAPKNPYAPELLRRAREVAARKES